MVKKVVYPDRRRKQAEDVSPYSINGSRSEKSKSLFSKLKGFFGSSWSQKQQEDNNQVNDNNSNDSSTTESEIGSRLPFSNLEPFKFRAPDANFINNISSRSIHTPGSSPNVSRNGGGIESPKQRLMHYLHEKGLSELEAEGILSIAKQIDEPISNYSVETQSILNDLKEEESRQKFTSQQNKPQQINNETNDNDYTTAATTNSTKNNILNGSEFKTPKTSISNTSTTNVNNTSISFANNSSIYHTAINKSSRNVSSAPSPFRLNIQNRNRNRLLLSHKKIANNSVLNDSGFVTAQEDITMKNFDYDKTKHNYSFTASTLLSILDENEGKKESEPVPKTPTGNKYEIYINPYSQSSLSKLKKRSSKESTPKKSEESIEPSLKEEKSKPTLTNNSPSFKVAPSSTPFGKQSSDSMNSKNNNNNNDNNNSSNTSPLTSTQLKYKPSKSSSLRTEVQSSPSPEKKITNFNFSSKPLDLPKKIIEDSKSDSVTGIFGKPMYDSNNNDSSTSNLSVEKSDSSMIYDSANDFDFGTKFVFPAPISQHYLLEDVDDKKVDQFKELFTFQ